ncbi:MAG: GatB/YqeY domain-containing protein [Gemmatimonadales bacterium]
MAHDSLLDTLQASLTEARKARDKNRTVVLSTTIAAIKNRRIELQQDLTDDDVVAVLRKGVKTRLDSVEQYRRGNRDDLVIQEQAEIEVLKTFLPPEVDPEEIRTAVRTAIAGGADAMGAVMGAVMPQFRGRADGKLINQIVREELQAG